MSYSPSKSKRPTRTLTHNEILKSLKGDDLIKYKTNVAADKEKHRIRNPETHVSPWGTIRKGPSPPTGKSPSIRKHKGGKTKKAKRSKRKTKKRVSKRRKRKTSRR
jgi:hypothetical protein